MQLDWQTSEAPKDGRHLLVCSGPYYDYWTFNQKPPVVVHYFDDGFYLSSGIVAGSENDKPVAFTHWCDIGGSEPRN